MEPGNTQPSPESAPIGPVTSPETAPGLAPAQPEQGPAPQEVKRPSEGANQNAGMSLPPVAVPQQPVVQTQPQELPKSTPTKSPGPAVADDVDLIEKEWVNKAKNIVNETKDDPYKQEQEVSKLQADYLKKRYGKDIKVPGE